MHRAMEQASTQAKQTACLNDWLVYGDPTFRYSVKMWMDLKEEFTEDELVSETALYIEKWQYRNRGTPYSVIKRILREEIFEKRVIEKDGRYFKCKKCSLKVRLFHWLNRRKKDDLEFSIDEIPIKSDSGRQTIKEYVLQLARLNYVDNVGNNRFKVVHFIPISVILSR